jgi:RNA polymerase sigma-70 factor (ECF subfamily)
LIARAKRGDEDAIAAIYTQFGGMVSKRIRSRLPASLRRHYDTADLWHSVFVEVVRELPDFDDRGEAALGNWLLVMGTRKVQAKLRRHFGRRKRRRPTIAIDGIELADDRISDPALAAERGDDGKSLKRRLERLDPALREVVDLRTRTNLSFAEIASRLGLSSADAARKRYARGLASLRSRMPEA